jgi:hypothetical protein
VSWISPGASHSPIDRSPDLRALTIMPFKYTLY